MAKSNLGPQGRIWLDSAKGGNQYRQAFIFFPKGYPASNGGESELNEAAKEGEEGKPFESFFSPEDTFLAFF